MALTLEIRDFAAFVRTWAGQVSDGLGRLLASQPLPAPPVVLPPSVPGPHVATWVVLTPGWVACAGVVVPKGQAWTALAVDGVQTQTDIKARWSDGSIKHALVSAQVTNAGTYTITAV